MTRAEKDRKFRKLDRRILHAADNGTLRDYSDLNAEINKAETGDSSFQTARISSIK